jgi:hypothetical protein
LLNRHRIAKLMHIHRMRAAPWRRLARRRALGQLIEPLSALMIALRPE